MTQPLRRSQFILSAGPGAIIESVNGPRIIPLPNIGLTNFQPDKYEISEPRMSKGLLHNKRIFYLPSNAELKKKDSYALYKTKKFPNWCLCNKHWILYKWHKGCSSCLSEGVSKRKIQEIRFVRACKKGHLDDVDWDYVVHENKRCNTPNEYKWIGKGSTLKDVEIQCLNCGKKVNFGNVYSRSWRCSGRNPEQEELFGASSRTITCEEDSHIIQRQASNLRIPEIVSLFTIPTCYTLLHKLLQIQSIDAAISATPPTSKGQLESMLGNLLNRDKINENVCTEILNYSWEEIEKAIEDVINQSVSSSYGQLIVEEFNALIEASENGVPPRRRPKPNSPILFEVDLNSIERFEVNGFKLRVTPINRLHTLIVQKGFTRMDPTDGKPVDISFKDDGGDRWLPGVEFLGEGIFIMFDDNEGFKTIESPSKEKWTVCSIDQEKSYPDYLFRDATSKDELNPVFVWWHTLSHLLLRVLAIDSGYSSASIRERVYVERTDKGVRGGIILYAVQPGSDGALGGLISLVPKFETILKRVFEIGKFCSNDPLCIEQKNSFKCGTSYNGAACYGCLLVSETSCEHRNMWLDRTFFVD